MSMPFGLVVLVAMFGIPIYQIISGKAINHNWEVWATREGQPGFYWGLVILESLVVFLPIGFLLYGYFASKK
jgi:hypothetical protein